MDSYSRLCVTRVRLLVLREITDAGGVLRPGQIVRALALHPSPGALTSSAARAAAGAVVKENDCSTGERVDRVKGVRTPPWKEST